MRHLKVLSVPKSIMLGLGIPVLIAGAVGTIISLISLAPLWLILTFAGIFSVGLSMVIFAGVLKKKVRKTLSLIQAAYKTN